MGRKIDPFMKWAFDRPWINLVFVAVFGVFGVYEVFGFFDVLNDHSGVLGTVTLVITLPTAAFCAFLSVRSVKAYRRERRFKTTNRYFERKFEETSHYRTGLTDHALSCPTCAAVRSGAPVTCDEYQRIRAQFVGALDQARSASQEMGRIARSVTDSPGPAQ